MKNLTDYLLENNIITKEQGKRYSKIIQGIEQWISDEYSRELQNWLIDEFAPEIQNWIIDEFEPEFRKWIKENFMRKLFKKKDNK